MSKTLISAERAHLMFAYNPETGLITRRYQFGLRKDRGPGSVAGSLHVSGYIHIRVGPRDYKAHRLAWLLTHGEWPSGQIDHINGVKTDNRLVNLRDVSNSVNLQNLHRARRDSLCGIAGVRKSRTSKNWQARITLNGVQHHLGTFSSQEEARATYIAAKRTLHPGSTL